ncbi:MAG: S8 family peptidase [bacterium]
MRLQEKLIIGLICVLCSAVLQVPSFGREKTDEVMIKFKEGATVSEIDSFTSSLGLVKVRSIDEISVDVFRVAEDQSVMEVVKLCSNVGFVEYAEPTQTVRALAAEEPPVESSAEPALAVQAETAEFMPGEVIIKFKTDQAPRSVDNLLSSVGIQVVKRFDEISALQCNITSKKSVLKTIEECRAISTVEYAEPNYIYKASIVPNDPRFNDLYGMRQIDAPEAWDLQKGSKSVIVGVIDTGVDTDHPDLKDNIWSNTGESGGGKESNGVDDDGNGFVDDFRGWDFINDDNNPFDDNDHGTHVSGTIGAVGDNNKGVVGVNWNVSIMPLKFLDGNGSGTTDDAVEAIIYGTRMGARVLSNSWGGGGKSRALEDAIKFANDNGVLFVAAAGNDFSNNDRAPTYPANYEVANVISVAANTSSDRLAGFSNFGKNTVDLSAPGNNIVSTVARGRYETLSGTSMATPHVSGAAGLIWAQFPQLSMNRIIIRLLGSVDRSINYADKVASGGRLNVFKAMSTSPIIARTTRLGNTLDVVGPYVVEADILDDSESTITSATLTYQMTGQEAVTLDMSATGSDHYRGDIPGQPLGSTILYFVSATDDEGNSTKDSNHTFSIAEPSNGGGCCGKPAVELAIDNRSLQTPLNALVNIGFFLLPIFAIRLRSKRKKN